MPSSYTPSLRLVLPVQGELEGTWGNTVNSGLTSLVDAAIAGTATVSMPNSDYTLTAVNEGVDEARQMFIRLTGTLSAQRNVVCPAVSKLYFVSNETTGGFGINFKTAAGTGVVVPNGARMMLYCNGTNVVVAANRFEGDVSGNVTGNVTGNISGSTGEFSGSAVIGGSAAPAVTLDVQTTGANALTSLFTTGLTDLNFRIGAMGGVAGGAGTTQGKLGLFYLGTGEVATIDFLRGATATDGSFAFRTSGINRATLNNSGDFVATGNITANSDIRLKTSVTRIDDALYKVQQLGGYTYTRIDTGKRQTGVIAQEVRAVLPEAVMDDGERLSVAYGNLAGLLIEAVKELTARVERLEGR
jgi:hypothetical protein